LAKSKPRYVPIGAVAWLLNISPATAYRHAQKGAYGPLIPLPPPYRERHAIDVAAFEQRHGSVAAHRYWSAAASWQAWVTRKRTGLVAVKGLSVLDLNVSTRPERRLVRPRTTSNKATLALVDAVALRRPRSFQAGGTAG
jgi:hypothetical protein